jgi:hypothetical protein
VGAKRGHCKAWEVHSAGPPCLRFLEDDAAFRFYRRASNQEGTAVKVHIGPAQSDYLAAAKTGSYGEKDGNVKRRLGGDL